MEINVYRLQSKVRGKRGEGETNEIKNLNSIQYGVGRFLGNLWFLRIGPTTWSKSA